MRILPRDISGPSSGFAELQTTLHRGSLTRFMATTWSRGGTNAKALGDPCERRRR